MPRFAIGKSYIFSKMRYIANRKGFVYHPDWLDIADGQVVMQGENGLYGWIKIPNGDGSFKQIVFPEDCEVASV